MFGKALPYMPAFQPYRGKPATSASFEARSAPRSYPTPISGPHAHRVEPHALCRAAQRANDTRRTAARLPNERPDCYPPLMLVQRDAPEHLRAGG